MYSVRIQLSDKMSEPITNYFGAIKCFSHSFYLSSFVKNEILGILLFYQKYFALLYKVNIEI